MVQPQSTTNGQEKVQAEQPKSTPLVVEDPQQQLGPPSPAVEASEDEGPTPSTAPLSPPPSQPSAAPDSTTTANAEACSSTSTTANAEGKHSSEMTLAQQLAANEYQIYEQNTQYMQEVEDEVRQTQPLVSEKEDIIQLVLGYNADTSPVYFQVGSDAGV